MPKLTICGGGNAAHVLIALAGHAGWEVDVLAPLYDEAERLRAGMALGGITAHFADRVVTGRAGRVGANPAEVVPGSELVLLALPAFAHGSILQTIAPFLDRGARLGALPARGGLDYQVRALLAVHDHSPPAPYTLFGLQTLPWACRITTYGREVTVLGTKAVVDLAAMPAAAAPLLARQLSPLFGVHLHPISSFLGLTLANTGQLIHPGIMVGLCRGREESTFDPDEVPLFYQGVDETTAGVLQAMSVEVQQLAGRLAGRLADFNSQEVLPLHEWLRRSYPADITDPHTLKSAFVTNRAYAGLRLPTRPAGQRRTVDFSSRYLAEDIPYGLAVVRGLAELAGLATPAIDEVILWAQARLGHTYLTGGQLAGPDLARTRAPQVYGLHHLDQLSAELLSGK